MWVITSVHNGCGFGVICVGAVSSERTAAVKKFVPLAVGLVLILIPNMVNAFAGETDITPLSNKDVLLMVQKHMSEDVIISTIKSSPCTFDTFPPVLKDMKRRGVSEAVLQAMIEAPYGPVANAGSRDELGADDPIYHYADQLKQFGYIAPTTSRRSAFPRQRDRVRASRTRRQ